VASSTSTKALHHNCREVYASLHCSAYVIHMSFLCHICVTLVPSFSHISPQAKGLASSCALRLHHLQGLLHLWAARIGLARARRSGDHVTHGRIFLKGWVEPNLDVTWWGNLTYPNHVSNVLSYIYTIINIFFLKKMYVLAWIWYIVYNVICINIVYYMTIWSRYDIICEPCRAET